MVPKLPVVRHLPNGIGTVLWGSQSWLQAAFQAAFRAVDDCSQTDPGTTCFSRNLPGGQSLATVTTARGSK